MPEEAGVALAAAGLEVSVEVLLEGEDTAKPVRCRASGNNSRHRGDGENQQRGQ